jgi:hypothetical protein
LREETDTWIRWCGVSEIVVLEEVVHDLLGLLLVASCDGVQAKNKPLLVFAFSLASMAAVVIAWGSTVKTKSVFIYHNLQQLDFSVVRTEEVGVHDLDFQYNLSSELW